MLSEPAMVLRFVWSHPANRGRRLRVLLRAVRFQALARLRGQRTIATVGEKSRLWAELGFRSSTRAVYANPPDWPEMLVWHRVPLAGATFIDVGANVGLYSLYIAERGAHVMALEPGRAAFERLVENAGLNEGYDIRALRVAAADVSGEIGVTQDRDTVNCIAEDGEPVRAVTIDGLLEGGYAAGVKIDVEGFERLVLEGASVSLRDRRIGLLQIEWNGRSFDALGEDRQPIEELLHQHGYELVRPDENGMLRPVRAPEIGADVFARPASDLDQ